MSEEKQTHTVKDTLNKTLNLEIPRTINWRKVCIEIFFAVIGTIGTQTLLDAPTKAIIGAVCVTAYTTWRGLMRDGRLTKRDTDWYESSDGR